MWCVSCACACGVSAACPGQGQAGGVGNQAGTNQTTKGRRFSGLPVPLHGGEEDALIDVTANKILSDLHNVSGWPGVGVIRTRNGRENQSGKNIEVIKLLPSFIVRGGMGARTSAAGAAPQPQKSRWRWWRRLWEKLQGWWLLVVVRFLGLGRPRSVPPASDSFHKFFALVRL